MERLGGWGAQKRLVGKGAFELSIEEGIGLGWAELSWERWAGPRTGKSMAGGHVYGSVIILVPAAGQAGEAARGLNSGGGRKARGSEWGKVLGQSVCLKGVGAKLAMIHVVVSHA